MKFLGLSSRSQCGASGPQPLEGGDSTGSNRVLALDGSHPQILRNFEQLKIEIRGGELIEKDRRLLNFHASRGGTGNLWDFHARM